LNPDSSTTDDEAVDESPSGDALSRWGVVNKNVTFFRDEQEMILKFVQLVKVKISTLRFVMETRKNDTRKNLFGQNLSVQYLNFVLHDRFI
jgi:hypothetical protein